MSSDAKASALRGYLQRLCDIDEDVLASIDELRRQWGVEWKRSSKDQPSNVSFQRSTVITIDGICGLDEGDAIVLDESSKYIVQRKGQTEDD